MTKRVVHLNVETNQIKFVPQQVVAVRLRRGDLFEGMGEDPGEGPEQIYIYIYIYIIILYYSIYIYVYINTYAHYLGCIQSNIVHS